MNTSDSISPKVSNSEANRIFRDRNKRVVQYILYPEILKEEYSKLIEPISKQDNISTSPNTKYPSIEQHLQWTEESDLW